MTNRDLSIRVAFLLLIALAIVRMAFADGEPTRPSGAPPDYFDQNANLVRNAVVKADRNLAAWSGISPDQVVRAEDMAMFYSLAGTMWTEDAHWYLSVEEAMDMYRDIAGLRQDVAALKRERDQLREDMDTLRARYGAMSDRINNTRPCVCP